MAKQYGDLEHAILCVIGFSCSSSHKSGWGGWQHCVLHFTDRFTRQQLHTAFKTLASDGLIELTKADSRAYDGDDQNFFFRDEFRATLTLLGKEAWQGLKPNAFERRMARVVGAA